ncbi:MAG: hypothetical protein IT256_07665 [Chitinophagaceae bacterium]|nr:hypothetical protein [Chitinophagaceae bacterium]
MSKALSSLLTKYEKDPSFELSIGINLRPLLLDALVALRLYAAVKKSLAQKDSMQDLIQGVEQIAYNILTDVYK